MKPIKFGSGRWAVWVAGGFWLGVIAIHFSLRYARYQMVFDMDQYWPVSLMLPKLPNLIDGITILAASLLGWVMIKLMVEAKRPFGWVMVLGFLTISATNLFQGFERGIVAPVLEANSYWVEGIKVTQPWSFITHFNAIQPSLVLHASSHPPGPVLYSALIYRLTQNPVWWSVVVAILGVTTSWFIYQYLRSRVDKNLAYYTAGLWLLLPAVQIYLIASIDAVVVLLMFLTYFAWSLKSRYRLILASISLFIVAWFTFAAVFLIPILIFDEWRKFRRIRESAMVIGLAMGLWILTYSLTGFNYWVSMRQATEVYAVGGLNLLVKPLSYLITRLEDILEIIVFLTPWLGWMIWQELRYWQPWRKQAWPKPEIVSFVASASLLGFFLLGGYATGETARNAGYIYPFLMISVAYFLKRIKAKPQILTLLAWLVFGQTIVMQMFGDYFW